MRTGFAVAILGLAISATASRVLVETSGPSITRTSSPLSTYPCTISAWYKPSNNTSNHSVVYLGSTADNRRFLLYRTGSGGGNVARASAAADTTGTSVDAIGTTPITNTARWYHLVAVFESSSARRIYVNGGLEGSTNGACVTTSLNRYAIGARGAPAPTWGVFASASIAEVAVWNSALSAGDISRLTTGENPRTVAPASRVSYVPLWTGQSPELDLDASTMTITGTATFSADHPPVFQ